MSNLIKPINWKNLPRDFLIIQIGFALFGLSIALLIQANLGASPWVMLTVALADLSGLTEGNITILTGFVVLVAALLMREQVGWGTLANILFIGVWLDLFLLYVPLVTGNLPLQALMLLASVLMMGMATAIYISANGGAGPRDSLMLAVERTTGLTLRIARASVELCVFLAGWLLDGPVGVGTVVFAFLIGPAVQWSFKLFKVKSHK